MLDIPGIEYFKKNTWCGSHKNKCCRIAVADGKFVVSLWDGPFCFEATPEECKENTEFEYSAEDLNLIKSFLNEHLL